MIEERFLGKNTKNALDRARTKLGPDACIVSTQRRENGVEVTAVSLQSDSQDSNQSAKTRNDQAVNEITLGYLDREVKALRALFYNALGDRAWQDVAGKKPVMSTVQQRLYTLGLSKTCIDVISSETDCSRDLNSAWFDALSTMTSAIQTKNRPLSESTRPKAIVGGTVSCRSLVCRQLLSQALENLRASQLVVISIAQDPSAALADFCKVEKIKHVRVASEKELNKSLDRFDGRRRVFIETSDLKISLREQDPILKLLKDKSSEIDSVVILPAVEQSEYLLATTQHIRELAVEGAVISKLPGAVALGPIIDTLILSETPLIGLSDEADKTLRLVTPNWLLNAAKRFAKIKLSRQESTANLPVYAQAV